MVYECEYHVHCERRTAVPQLLQRKLTIVNGILSLAPPPTYQIRRTPAGKAVRNIVNAPTFRTTDSSLTTFLRFPPEVRIQIYRYLLISQEIVQYGICPIKWCLVGRQRTRPAWLRHGIFPSILECCRKINEEGSAILYGKNIFQMERYYYHCNIVDLWSPARANLLSITRLSLLYLPRCWCLHERKALELMNLLPALREVKIRLDDVLAEEWVVVLEDASGTLQRMKKFMLEIHVLENAGPVIRRQWPWSQNSLITDEDRCLWTYQEPFLKQQDFWKNRGVKWEFEEEISEMSRCYGILGILRVYVE